MAIIGKILLATPTNIVIFADIGKFCSFFIVIHYPSSKQLYAKCCWLLRSHFWQISAKSLHLKKSSIHMLKIGDKMPPFEVVDQDGQVVRSEDFIGKGRKTIIYFYPKDNTSGCTAEACSFRDNYAELTAAGYNVVGVSKDSVKSHTGFRAKYDLPFKLLADTSTEMLQAFGAWGEKKMYGKTVLGTLRRTFIFAEDGTLERIIEKVDTKNAVGQIL